MSKYVIVGTQRSGTTYLRHCLNSHPEITCHGEVFQKLYPDNYGYYQYIRTNPVYRVSHYLARSAVVSSYLNKLYSKSRGVNIGFKLMYSQVRFIPYAFPMVIDYLKKNEISIIHVIRRNVLKTHLSRLAAEQRQLYHAKQEQAMEQVHVETKGLLHELRKIEGENAWWREKFSSGRYLDVEYERFILNKDEQSKRMLDFMNVRRFRELTSSNVKINPDDLTLLISNYEDVDKCLADTEFEYCLD